MAQPDARAEESADVARGVDESLEGLLLLLWRTEDAYRDAGVAQIGTNFHFGYRGEADARIFDFLSDDRAYLVLQLLGQPLRTVRHKAVGSGEWGVGSGKSLLPTPHSPLPTPYSNFVGATFSVMKASMTSPTL